MQPNLKDVRQLLCFFCSHGHGVGRSTRSRTGSSVFVQKFQAGLSLSLSLSLSLTSRCRCRRYTETGRTNSDPTSHSAIQAWRRLANLRWPLGENRPGVQPGMPSAVQTCGRGYGGSQTPESVSLPGTHLDPAPRPFSGVFLCISDAPLLIGHAFWHPSLTVVH
jgi:hypothetical protein